MFLLKKKIKVTPTGVQNKGGGVKATFGQCLKGSSFFLRIASLSLRRMWRKLKMGSEGRAKGFVVVTEKLRFGNLVFFCYQTRQSGPQSTVQNHCVYILQLAVHTVQMNWICRLGRYLMVSVLVHTFVLP